jgi:regulator of replication initiation timing
MDVTMEMDDINAYIEKLEVENQELDNENYKLRDTLYDALDTITILKHKIEMALEGASC